METSKQFRKAIAYLRTSSAANVGADKDSDKRQRAAIDAYAKREKWEIVEEFYDADVSGADPIETRPGFSALLDRIEKGEIEKKPIVTVNANGASVGKVYVWRDRCGITDDVIIVEVKQPQIDLDYLAIALRAAVYKGGFLYEAKLFATRVKELQVEIPVSKTGDFDVKQQQAISSAVRRFDALRTRRHDLGLRSGSVRTV